MSGNQQNSNETSDFSVVCAGNTYTQADAKGLEHISVEAHIDMIDVAQVTFGRGCNDIASFEIGADLEIKMGSNVAFKGFITGIRHSFQKGANVITVIGMDPQCKLAASRHVRVFEDMKDSDMFTENLEQTM